MPRLGGLPAETIARATALAERAVARAPVRPAARIVRSRLRLAAGDVPGAFADAVVAARLHPLRAEYAAYRDRLRDALPSARAR